METIHVSDVEAARDLPSLLAKVRAGATVVIEHDAQAVATMNPPEPRPLSLRERLAQLPEESSAVMDEDFARDVEEARAYYRNQPQHDSWA